MAIIPIEFSIGYLNEEQEESELVSMQKLDLHVYVRRPSPPQIRANLGTGEVTRRIIFCMLVERGQEKALFFKLKLKHPEFKRHL